MLRVVPLLGLVVAGSLLWGAAPAAAQDVAAGEKSFIKCKVCHQIGENAKNMVGPVLNGLFGRPAGSVPGFAYSSANKNSGITWTPEIFAEYIKDPKAKVPGTKMAFAGIKNDQEIADLTAYIKQFDASGKKTGG